LSNELRILPLRKYEVTFNDYVGGDNFRVMDVFTADFHDVTEGRTRFYRTGNVIREYHTMLHSIVITPVDDEAIAA
jgi:hypothetical protein